MLCQLVSNQKGGSLLGEMA